MEIKNFINKPVQSHFSPQWNFYIVEDIIFNDAQAELIKNIILNKEKEIVESHPYYGDGGTNLDSNSLTSRFPYFNLMKWDEPELDVLKIGIHNTYVKFLNELQIDRRNTKIKSWANVLRKGQSIDYHAHSSSGPWSYISGHITISTEDTSTYYANPIITTDVYKSENKVGKITLFNEYIPHWTDTYNGEKERITVAFDIFLSERPDCYSFTSQEAVDFDSIILVGGE